MRHDLTRLRAQLTQAQEELERSTGNLQEAEREHFIPVPTAEHEALVTALSWAIASVYVMISFDCIQSASSVSYILC